LLRTGFAQPKKVRIADRSTLRGLLRDTHIRFGDAYSTGQIEVEGDLVKFMATVFRTLSQPTAQDSIRESGGRLAAPAAPQHAGGVTRQHSRHYDLGNAFYALWLG